MKQQHTPGPWKVNHMDEIRDAQNNLLASVWDVHVIRSTAGYIELIDNPSKANARLMAAAPEMFDAMRDLYNASVLQNIASDTALQKAITLYEELNAKIEGDE